MDDYNTVLDVYDRVSRIEIGYRGLDIDPSGCLKDTIDSCICILGRGGIRQDVGLLRRRTNNVSGRF